MTQKVLIVDDEPQVSQVLQTFLVRAGYTIAIARNGVEGLDKVAQLEPDVIITDIQMPIIGGQELCERSEQEFPRPGRLILVMTSRTDREIRLWAETMANVELVEKPLSPRRLLNRLADFFDVADELTGTAA